MSDVTNPYRPPDAPLRDPPSRRRAARWTPALAYATLSAASALATILGSLARAEPDGRITLPGGRSVVFADFASLRSVACVLALGTVAAVSLSAAIVSVTYNGRDAALWMLIALPICLAVGFLLQVLLL